MEIQPIPNPVIPGFYPDPSVCKVGDDFYLVTSSFEYFPGVPIFHSTDLIEWKQIGHCLTRKSQLDLSGRKSSDGIFAPTLRFHEGIFYMITTDVGGSGHFYVTSENPAGPWSDPIFVEGPGFDPDLFFDDDGKVYFTREDITGYGIRQFEIDILTGKLLTPEKLIWKGFEDLLCEAPHIYKINGVYYLLVAEGGTHRGHMVVIARGPNPWGPFESCPDNPILTHRHRVLHEVQALGHGDLIQKSDGSWWILFLGIRQVSKWHILGRETFLAPVEWIDGWPVINNNQPIEAISFNKGVIDEGLNVSKYFNEPSNILTQSFFKDGQLNFEWNFRGWHNEDLITLDTQNNIVKIKPSFETLQLTLGSGFLGRRQQHFNFQFQVELDISELGDSNYAGITVYMNEKHYASVGVFKAGDEYIVTSKKQIGTLIKKTNHEGVLKTSKIIIVGIRGSRDWYELLLMDSQELVLDRIETRYLSTEVAGGFTGIFLGIFCELLDAKVTSTGYAKFMNPQYKFN